MPQHSTGNQFSSSNPQSKASINVKKKIGRGNTVSIKFLRSSVFSNNIAWSFITIKSTLYWRTKGICRVLNATQLKCGLWSNWGPIVEIKRLLFLHWITPGSLQQYLYRTTPGSLHQYLYRTTPGSLYLILISPAPLHGMPVSFESGKVISGHISADSWSKERVCQISWQQIHCPVFIWLIVNSPLYISSVVRRADDWIHDPGHTQLLKTSLYHLSKYQQYGH